MVSSAGTAVDPAPLPRYSDLAREEGWADRDLIETLGTRALGQGEGKGGEERRGARVA